MNSLLPTFRPSLLAVAVVAVLCGRGAPMLGATATETILSRPDLAAVKMAILAFYIPFAVQYAIKNRPAPFDPRNVPDDILPK